MSKSIWSSSIHEFKKLRVVIFCGLMGALAVALSYFGSIPIGPYAKIGITELPNLMVDFLFGPAAGAIFGGAMDLVKFMANPDGGFFPGYTLTAVTAGIIFGLFLYRKKVSFVRLLIAEFLVKLICNVGMNTLWAVILYQKAVAVILPVRIVTNLIQLPIDTLLIYLMLRSIGVILRKKFSEDQDR